MKFTKGESLHYFRFLFLPLLFGCAILPRSGVAASLHNSQLSVSVNPRDGSYAISAAALQSPVLEARVGAEVNHRWLKSSEYAHLEQRKTISRTRWARAGRSISHFPDLLPNLIWSAHCAFTTISHMERCKWRSRTTRQSLSRLRPSALWTP